MTPLFRRTPVATRVLITGNAETVVSQLTDGARRRRVDLVDLAQPAEGERADLGIAAVRTRSRSTLALGIQTLNDVAELLTDDAARLVIAVRPSLTRVSEVLARPLTAEILFQAALATDGVAASEKLRRARARWGSAVLDAAGLHVFRIGRMQR